MIYVYPYVYASFSIFYKISWPLTTVIQFSSLTPSSDLRACIYQQDNKLFKKVR